MGDPSDSPQVVRFFNNYWIAPADVRWPVQSSVGSRKDCQLTMDRSPYTAIRAMSPPTTERPAHFAD